MRNILRRAAAQFERNGLSRCAIRQCEQEFPEAFLNEGIRILIEADDSAGYRFLAALLVKSPGVFEKVTDRWELTREQALSVSKRLHRADQNFDTKLTGLLPGEDNSYRPFALRGENAERALEILDEISPGRRIVPIMRHLTRHPDSKISSKAALLIGKRLQNLAWARRVITESTDARLRANAIETMWGLNTPDVIDLFRECLADWDNRVVGNAIIGLHRAGEAETMDMAARIAADPSPKLRMTAAWAIGQIGDPALVRVLSPLAKDSHPEVRRAALRSLRAFQIVEKRTREAALETKAPDDVEKRVEPEEIPVEPVRVTPQRQFWG